MYLKKTGNYFREGNITEGLLNSPVTIGMEWNFNEFNFMQDLTEDFQEAKQYFKEKNNSNSGNGSNEQIEPKK